MISKKLFVLFFLISSIFYGQEIPPIQIFTTKDYKAEDQNWSISQASTDQMYFANNKGLLEYNGERWQLYKTPNESILRSVRVIDGRVYSGCYMDFGYWEKDSFGKLNYTSLVKELKIKLIEDEQFWNIVSLENYILFQSLNHIYIYNTINGELKVIESQNTITKIYKVDDTIYYQKFSEGLFKIENGEEKQVTASYVIKDKVIINVFDKEGDLLIQTKENGFYIFKNNNVEVWNENLKNTLYHNSIYSSIQLKEGGYLLGTVSHGIILLDEEGNIKLKIDQANGLSNNTVLSLFEDSRGNIWLGLDNGINNINLNSPFTVYNDDSGVLGTVYTSLVHDDKLYLGTNQGLFYRNLDSHDNFNFVEGTEGQVWCLQNIDGTFFCGHDKGTFIIENNQANLFSEVQGTWQLQKIKSMPDFLLQGNYSGLYVLQNSNGKWVLRNKLEGFDISSRYFEFVNDNQILVNHEYKGVYKLNINEAFTAVDVYKKESVPKGDKSGLVSYNNSVLYAYEDGVYEYKPKKELFQKDSSLSKLIGFKQYVSGKLIADKTSDKLWAFSENSLNYVEPGKISSNYRAFSLSLPNDLRKTKVGYENLLELGSNKYLMGATNGYLVFDLDKLNSNNYEVSIALNGVTNYALNEDSKALNIDNESQLSNKNNNISFEYSVTNFDKFLNSKYQYRLLGFNNNWSDWVDDSSVLYENLPYGNYTFEAKAKVGNTISENTISYKFEINKPWFLKPLAIALYILILVLLLAIVHWLNQRHYKKQRAELLKKKERELEIKGLENQKQLMQFKNQNLQQDIENKNRELGMSTMNLINKNELLNDIKKELVKAKKIEDLKSVIKLINKNLNTTDDWKLFEEAFNNADKDFLKKIKHIHPSLTSNDLRLCAYLRLNLSSKEIAPLLNISPKSVEVKRYRLRKKMNLGHDVNLTDYILQI
ncbi:helix-turn-helix and ligand-binding sensor domain-containing protein [Winogradskyella marincola]|uniref:Triple tyrosine motif-containing protein n=1 Tax=Winogradskyella marincola TaxID=3037795 RepID=A0ABT6G1F2_9FLAO|nr:triple tyrosine motif-containing protein [Winogradskyella sp. YYF002]MDG4715871.1 triple tyrosine motif-containing protein [Winogradskyella sp. YYF002]